MQRLTGQQTCILLRTHKCEPHLTISAHHARVRMPSPAVWHFCCTQPLLLVYIDDIPTEICAILDTAFGVCAVCFTLPAVPAVCHMGRAYLHSAPDPQCILLGAPGRHTGGHLACQHPAVSALPFYQDGSLLRCQAYWVQQHFLMLSHIAMIAYQSFACKRPAVSNGTSALLHKEHCLLVLLLALISATHNFSRQHSAAHSLKSESLTVRYGAHCLQQYLNMFLQVNMPRSTQAPGMLAFSVPLCQSAQSCCVCSLI